MTMAKNPKSPKTATPNVPRKTVVAKPKGRIDNLGAFAHPPKGKKK